MIAVRTYLPRHERPAEAGAAPDNPALLFGAVHQASRLDRSDALKGALLGRNHRQPETKARLELAIARTRALLELPDGYRLAIVPASDTGAVEMALWSLLGPRGVDVLAWEAFSRDWVTDIIEQLKLKDVRALLAPTASCPIWRKSISDRDVVFAWNGTTSGVRVPNGDWIAADRKGLTICDATSAVFAQEIDWTKLDAATFSWQKVLGGEAQHGMLILSPARGGAAGEPYAGLAAAEAVPHDARRQAQRRAVRGLDHQHALDALRAGLSRRARLGGKRRRLAGTIARSNANASIIAEWVARTPWVDFLARVPETRSNTSVCLKIVDPEVMALPPEHARGVAPPDGGAARSRECRQGHRCLSLCPAGLAHLDRRHRGKERLEALLPWLDWAFAVEKQALAKAA